MAELPTLPELVQRKLDVHWEDLCDTHNSYLKLYEMQLARAEVRTGHLKVSYEVAIGEHLIKKTISLAETRFLQTVEEYLRLWASAEDARSQTFAEWLGTIQTNTISEIAGVWAAHCSCAEFFESACRGRLEEHLRTLVQVWKSSARRLEIQHLENPHLALASLIAAGGDLNIAFTLEQSKQTLEAAQRTLDSLEVAKEAGQRPIPRNIVPVATKEAESSAATHLASATAVCDVRENEHLAARVQLERNQKMRQDLDYEFDRLLTDILVLHKTDGRVFENIKARVSTKGILITDVHLPIEFGDKLIRTQLNGLKDEFIVDDPGYQAGLQAQGVPAHFQVKVHRAVAERLVHSPVALELHVSGAQETQAGSERKEAPTAEGRSPKELVDRCRRRLKIRSYEKCAAKVGVSKDTLYAITKETRWVSDQVYELVAEFCGCKPEDLYPGDIPRPDRRPHNL